MTSSKGGAVLWGLNQLHAAGHTTLAYTDLDLTYPSTNWACTSKR
ncbi:hypothetical protein NKH18_47830 [Streptomyces sp. M10(2022)]